MEDKQMTTGLQQLGNRKVNAAFKITDMPKYFQEFVRARLSVANDNYVWEAQYSPSNDNEKLFGLEVIKDYYKQVNLIYKARDNRYVGVEIADIFNKTELDTRSYITWDIENPQQSKYEHVLQDLLKGNYKVVHDYDKENFEEALELGDTGLLEDIIGDRDITEFI